MDLSIANLIRFLNDYFTFYVIFPLIFLIGIYLSFRLSFVQLSKLKLSFSYLLKKQDLGQGNISHYEAVSAVLAGNFGTGNISGMAVALATGGPGSLVWMWIMAFFGAVIQYASCLLGVQYRQKNSDGEYVGGPMYYLNKGMGVKILGTLFSLFAIMAALTVGNFAQINSVTLPLESLELNPLLCSFVIAFLVGVVVLGGMQRVAKVASSIVPLMAFLYLSSAVYILFENNEKIIPCIALMFKAAFNNQAIIGGTLGFTVVKAISTGFGRGIFATDTGTGLAPIIQSSARTTSPVIDGIVALTPPFLVMIVCTITGLVLMVTDAWQVSGLQSTNMCTFAFEKGLGHHIGCYIVIISLLLFAYTTVLTWACCATKAVEYLWGKQCIRWFQYLYIAFIPIGALVEVDVVWLIADFSVALMTLINLIGIIGLSSEVIQKSKDFFQEVDPQPSVDVLEAAP